MIPLCTGGFSPWTKYHQSRGRSLMTIAEMNTRYSLACKCFFWLSSQLFKQFSCPISHFSQKLLIFFCFGITYKKASFFFFWLLFLDIYQKHIKCQALWQSFCMDYLTQSLKKTGVEYYYCLYFLH